MTSTTKRKVLLVLVLLLLLCMHRTMCTANEFIAVFDAAEEEEKCLPWHKQI